MFTGILRLLMRVHIRKNLENDAMIKARYLAKEYMDQIVTGLLPSLMHLGHIIFGLVHIIPLQLITSIQY